MASQPIPHRDNLANAGIPLAGAEFTSLPPWYQQIRDDLLPTPGRLSSSLRIVLAAVIALVLLLVLQLPAYAVGLYFIFQVGRDSPAVSFRTSALSLIIVTLAVVLELGVIIVTDNDPMARVLSIAVVVFIAGLLTQASTLGPLASVLGIIYCTAMGLWENHAPADRLVKGSLYLLGTIAIPFGCAVAVEYVFGGKDPVKQLTQLKRERYQALEALFRAHAEGADPSVLSRTYLQVARLASTGQSPMQSLYNVIVARNLNPQGLPIGLRVRISMLAELMDVSAAFGASAVNRVPLGDDSTFRRRCLRIADQCHLRIDEFIIEPSDSATPLSGAPVTMLDKVEDVLHTIVSMPVLTGTQNDTPLVAVSTHKLPLFVASEFRNPATIAFALKLSLCATLCYIVYHAIDYPGISTSVVTVVITGLSTSGAIKQKSLYRLVGSTIGGLFLGIGATSLLLPHMDSITSLILLVAPVTFAAAWLTGGRRFSYIGAQLALSFYLVTLDGPAAPTALAPARDRLIGILLAQILMWFVFDQVWPVRTVGAMRQALASVLRNNADLLRLHDKDATFEERVNDANTLRDHIGKTVTGLRTMNDTVQYEFGADRQKHMKTSELILGASFLTAALFWNQLVALERREDSPFAAEPSLIEMRRRIAARLDAMAEAVSTRQTIGIEDATELRPPEPIDPRYQEYVEDTRSRFRDLERIVAQVPTGR